MSASIKRDKQEDVRIREIHVNISEVKRRCIEFGKLWIFLYLSLSYFDFFFFACDNFMEGF